MCLLDSCTALLLLGCWMSGSAVRISDVTLVNPDPVVSPLTAPSLLCVSSDWSSGGSVLALGQEFPRPQGSVLALGQEFPHTEPRPHPAAATVTWSSRSHAFGAFYCQIRNSTGRKIYTYKMLQEAAFLPESLTITVNQGENINISYSRRLYSPEDTVIHKNGHFEHSSPKEDISDIIHYPVTNAKAESHAGIYAIRYISAAPSSAAITRLIVRSCRAGFWGPNCTESCPRCANGGVCDDTTGECVCPPGFRGHTCDIVCGEGRFGAGCKERCVDGVCRALVFCLRDPYGCSCASGWRGLSCNDACPDGYYGAGCTQKCVCAKGRCDRFRGCVCAGRHGSRCEEADSSPVISHLRDVEINTGVELSVNCSASGRPAPLHGDITLITANRTTIAAVDTHTLNDQSTSVFRVQQVRVSSAGRWRCQVNNTHAQVEDEFTVEVKVPPRPQNPPVLQGSGPRHLLLLLNTEPYSGDGPIATTTLLYRPASAHTWSSFTAHGPLVRLDNLYPMTQYLTQVQLSRPGPGGAGQAGPAATFSTQVLELPVGVKLSAVSQTALLLSWDIAPAEQHCTYEVSCLQAGAPGTLRTFQLPSNSSAMHLSDLKPRHKYQCTVRSSCGVGQNHPSASAWTLSDQLPPPPANISIWNISDTSAVLTWAVAEGESVSRAVIRFQQVEQAQYRQQVELPVQTQQLHMRFQLLGLRPNTGYQLQLWTVNNMGESAESPPVSLMTLPQQESSALFAAHGHLLLYAILGSAGMTCCTVLLAFCIVLQLKRNTLQRRIHSILREEPAVHFSSAPPPHRRSAVVSRSLVFPALQWSDIQFQDVLGEGNFGQVLKARIRKDGLRMDAAVKRMKDYASQDDHRDFAGELEVLCRLGPHKNIIHLLGACEHRGYLYLAIEFAPHGNLLDFLRKSRVLETDPAFAIAHRTASTLSSQQLLAFSADVARGMSYLSQKQFIHRDLAARNVLVGENFVAKIADFGLSRGQEVYVKKTMGRLPVRWMAIESLNYSVYTTNSDVWSYGVLLWEVVSLGGTPYCGMTCAELYEKLPLGFRLEKPLNCDDEVYELMQQCWREKPFERPSFSQILLSLGRMLEERKTYVNTTLYEKFTYAGIDCSAEEAG
nr:Endothelium-specific receptor tyrosine kinase 2 [Danio rerio]